MYKKLSAYYLAVFCSLFLMLACNVHATEKQDSKKTYSIQSIEANLQGSSIVMLVKGDNVPAYTMYELFSPARLVIDIAEADLAQTIDVEKIVPENSFATLKITTLNDKKPKITRFEITLAETHTYKVNRLENNLSIRLFPRKQNSIASPVDSGTIPILHDLVVRSQNNKTEILLQADTPIKDFREETVTGRDGLPDSMFIDINNIDGSELMREKAVGTNLDKIRVATRGTGVRIVFDSGQKGLFPYDIQTVPQGLLITVDEKPVEPGKKNIANSGNVSDPTLEDLIDSSEKALTNNSKSEDGNVTAADAMQDSFQFSGYKSTRISVDFYKIDLHNVFRLFRQISGVNLIVDEAVSGSLTLALNDVPWDFALDIILNLKDLKKEERHNTIVIYPAKKEFIWPERGSDNLSFEADTDVIEQEALIIQQATNQPAEIMKAKELLQRAKIKESNGDIEDAASFYEQAFKLWPQNAKISNRLAALYLVDLRINAKAVYFAKETLKIDKKNYQAALYAAIASANMDQVPAAMEYFSQSINGDQPMKEALISYAAFSEKKGQPEAALKLLNRYSDVYSDTVDTMISRARVLDSMGQTEKATNQYKTLLYSGYQLTPGLKKYIHSRLTTSAN